MPIPTPGPPHPLLRVLHVEDDRVGALLFAQLLLATPAWCELRQAEDCAEALNLLADGWLPDVLVLDRHLPDGTGDQLLLRLRERPALAQTPAYLCSADAPPAAVVAGFSGFWAKPATAALVLRTLQALPRRDA